MRKILNKFISRRKLMYIYRYLKYLFMRERWRVFVAIGNGKPHCIKMGRHEWHKDFCADCFLYVHNDILYLFYETVDSNNKGLLGCFEFDGSKWHQKGPIMNMPWHMSYPQVFDYEGVTYMIPEQSDEGRGDVSLYKATEFPHKWEKMQTLINMPFADSTLVCKENHWYLACYMIPPNETAELWHAPSLTGPWERHPQFYNINQSRRLRRCGGRYVEMDGRLYRIAQDCNGSYGKRLFRVPIERVTPYEYIEGSAECLYVNRLFPNEDGKHTYNEVQWKGEKVVAYDSKKMVLKPISEVVSIVYRLILHKIGGR